MNNSMRKHSNSKAVVQVPVKFKKHWNHMLIDTQLSDQDSTHTEIIIESALVQLYLKYTFFALYGEKNTCRDIKSAPGNSMNTHLHLPPYSHPLVQPKSKGTASRVPWKNLQFHLAFLGLEMACWRFHWLNQGQSHGLESIKKNK